MTLETLARSDVVTASPDTDVRELATMMDEEMVGSVVIADGGEPVGIVTDRDLALATLLEDADPDTTAESVMSGEIHTIGIDAGFYEATERMNEHNVRRLPVVDDDGHLTGIITLDDLSELLADEQSELVGVIREQRAPY